MLKILATVALLSTMAIASYVPQSVYDDAKVTPDEVFAAVNP